MSRLVYIELESHLTTNLTMKKLLNFFKNKDIQYKYDKKLHVQYSHKEDIEIGYILEEDLTKKVLQAIFTTYHINDEKYSIGFWLKSPSKIELSFGRIKKIDNEFADFSWAYKYVLKDIHEELFQFSSIVYHDLV